MATQNKGLSIAETIANYDPNTTAGGLDNPQGFTDTQEPTPMDWRTFLVDTTQIPPKPLFRLNVGGVEIIPSGGIVAVTGQAKQGKTHFLLAMVSVLMSGKPFGRMSRGEGVPRSILWVDTEQSLYYVTKNVNELLDLCGYQRNVPTDNYGLNVLALLGNDCETMLEVIQAAIDELHPDIVVIDGVRDLVSNFNDEEETQRVMTWLNANLKADPSLNIFCAIHTNPTDKTKMRGHLGTELANKCSDMITVCKNKGGYFEAEHTMARGRTYEPAFTFRIGEKGAEVYDIVNVK